MRTATVIPYDRQWPTIFEKESLLLKAVAGEVIIAVHHIGSTAVPGLSAKPVIDILLEVVGLNELDRCTSALARAGYRPRGENGIVGRRYFIKGGDRRSHQVHAFAEGNSQIVKHLAFRDYLIKNATVAAHYARIKYAAVLAANNDIHRYSALKADFIEYYSMLALNDADGPCKSDSPESPP
ncbi:GrpB family protein [Pantoea sp. ACRSB]|uniref:GrpB family protein n=1 Tax=Pantoea sp. ACRSB TaxID=2918207 RepID=UPI002892D643|nr:GrpB family protein [Pantoea sp. ACRSB]MCG7387852.1 GrpB family protein [Pantoea sp. ACRSB]